LLEPLRWTVGPSVSGSSDRPTASFNSTSWTPSPPPPPELVSSLQSQIFDLVLAQPSWPPSRIRQAAFCNLGLPSATPELHRLVDAILSSVIGFENTFSTYLSAAASVNCTHPIACILSGIREFQHCVHRPTDSCAQFRAKQKFQTWQII